MFHDMGFIKRNHAAWLKSNDIDVHIVTHIRLFGKSRGFPNTIGFWHLNCFNIMIAGDKGFWRIKSFYKLLGFANPVKFNRLITIIF